MAMAVLFFTGSAATADKKTCKIAYAQWSCASAASHVVKAVLEEKMGYDCELTPVGAAALWQATASGSVDGFVCAWLPSLHQHYYAKVEDNVIDLGPNLAGTKVGLVVPNYVSVDSIAGLDAHAEKFDNKITGIDPGAGIMTLTEEAMEIYDMAGMKLVGGSGAIMTDVLSDKIKNKEWVVVTGWTPHWKFARWDLKYLKDPENVYGGAEYIHTVVRTGLRKDKPDLYRFLDNFHWEARDLNQVMNMIQESDAPYKSAVEWVQQHPDKVQRWLPDVSEDNN
ncbi:MAG: glycine betaine ABC transporter substrate-binding protein [Desulfobacterales bacterium]|nr:glycine betaine ABC transporter substrate-binding protein [Desulfobacterales bacterium]